MKTTFIALGFPLIFLLSYQFFEQSEKPQKTTLSEQAQESYQPTASKNSEEGPAHRPVRKSRFREAWENLPDQNLNQKERFAIQMSLLQEWAAADMESALEAVLAEPWGGQASNDWSQDLLRSMELQMWAQSDLIAQLVNDNHFGHLGTSKLESAWFAALSFQDPAQLASLLPSFKDASFVEAVSHLRRDMEQHAPEIWQEIKNRKDLAPETLLKALNQQDPRGNYPGSRFVQELDREELLASYNTENPNLTRIITALLAEKNRESPFTSLQDIPTDQHSFYALQVIRNNKKATVVQDAVEQMIANQGWDEIRNNITTQSVDRLARNSDPAEVAAWAANLPQHDKARAVFQSGIKPYIQQQPEAAWTWLEEFETGLWRDRGFGELSQHALYRQGDPELSRRALEMIDEPAFKQEAEGWRSDWEEQQGNH